MFWHRKAGVEMDKASRMLDKKYMALQLKQKQADVHSQAIATLTETISDDAFIREQVDRHGKAIRELEREAQQERLDFLDDLLLVDDPNVITVLKLRYLDYLSWDAISARMGCQRRWAMMMRDRGLACIVSKRRDQ